MTKEEFIKKYAWAPKSASECHQITWDLLEEMVETFEGVDVETAIGATLYDVDCLLEVMRDDIPDRDFLTQLKTDLNNVGQ